MAAEAPPSLRIEPLGQQHDRGAFCCGNDLIDDFCKARALKEHEKYRSRVFVACEDESNEVLGFYALSVRSIAARRILNIGFGGRDIPAIYLGMIGVREERAGKKIGTALIYDAFNRVSNISENVGVYCLWLTSVSEERVGWYESLTFSRLEAATLDMFVPLETIRTVLSE